mmetsp:Transcript_41865/g.100504  ORF Transcript_41865/g.100504 Transcript_41865/m.100504 type:complete len:429 (+) Transcript_41865:128-1414(+)
MVIVDEEKMDGTTDNGDNNNNKNIVDNADDSNSEHYENDDGDGDEWIDSIVESKWQDMVEIGLIVKWPLLRRNGKITTTPGSSCSMQKDKNEPMQQGQSSTANVEAEVDADKNTCPDQYHRDQHHKPLVLSTQLSHTQLSPLFDGTAWAGTRVWKAALLAIQYLEEQYYLTNGSNSTQSDRSPQQRPSSLSLLELGCGLGVPGMVWHTIMDDSNSSDSDRRDSDNDSSWCKNRVVLTDMKGLVPQLQANIAQNFGGGHINNENETDINDDEEKLTTLMIEALPLDWSTEDGIKQLLDREESRKKMLAKKINDDDRDNDYNDKEPIFDIVLNCDCIYEPLYGRKAWEDLADLLAVVAHRSLETLIVTSVERRNHDGLDNFMERFARNMQQTTTSVPTDGSKMDRVLYDDSDPHHVIEIYTTRGCDWLST